MVWDTRSHQPTPVATLGVKAGEQRTTHTGEPAHVTCRGRLVQDLASLYTRRVRGEGLKAQASQSCR